MSLSSVSRQDGRAADQLRAIKITEDFVQSAEASFLIEVGRTRILCCASVEEDLPRWLKGKGSGWVTAEYSLLPRSTGSRVKRERNGASGRTQEIQRLIGRALRGVCDLTALGERSIVIDCDVIEADGGTRTASIVGAYLALARALQKLKVAQPETFTKGRVLKHFVSAVSVGMHAGQPLLDLCYTEDSEAEVDMNVVMTETGDFVEVQGTGEEAVFSRKQLDALLGLAEKGCRELITLQQGFLGMTLP
jgi:ribonuclease PH